MTKPALSNIPRELLRGQNVLIVGGGGAGIGRAITTTLATAGANVGVVDFDAQRAEQAAAEARSFGVVAVSAAGDVRNGDDIERVVAEVAAQLGSIDTLVTVAGGLIAFGVPFQRIGDFSDEQWDTIFDMNLRYVFRLLRPVLKLMAAQPGGGSIVCIGSNAGTGGHGSPLTPAYGAAKAGLAHLAMTVATEYGADGIRMNIVSPGPTETPATSSISAAAIVAMSAATPLQRRAQPEDIAAAVLYFVSPLAAHVTGQVLGVDGGLSVQSPMPALSGGAPPAG